MLPRLAALALVAFMVAGVVAPAPEPEAGWAILRGAREAPAQRVWTPQEWSARSSDDGPPIPGIQDGLGTGSAMQQTSGSSGYICTAAFLLRDPATGTYYLATAGHCLVKDEADKTPYTGAANPDKMHDYVDVCVAQCISNALGLGEYVRFKPADGHHPIVFAQSGGVGRDFGILQIPEELHGELRPHMPQWGGPTGAGSTSLGDLLLHYGHGSYCCPVVGAVATRTPVDQGRIAASLGAGGDSFSAVGHVTGGDSGSGIVRGTTDASGGIVGAEAVGVITHGLVVAGNEFSGTLLGQGLAMVEKNVGLRLEVVLAGDPLPRGPTAAPPSSNVTITSPADGASVALAAKKLAIRGTADHGGQELPDGAAVQVAVDDPAFGIDSRVPVIGNGTWSATWDLAGERAGKHVVRARLVDGEGLVLDQHNVTVTLTSSTTTATGTATTTGATTATGTGAPAGSNVDPASQDDGDASGDKAADAKRALGTPGPSWVLVAGAVAAVALALRRRD